MDVKGLMKNVNFFPVVCILCSSFGVGETSIVFQAIFSPTNESVAIKYINDYTKDRKGISRELHVMKFSHLSPYLVHYHSHFRVKAKCYIVTEQLSHLNFNQLLSPHLTLPPTLVKIYTKQLSKAIMFLHERKIIHRDVTLDNLNLDYRGNLRLIDYNLSRTVTDPMGTTFSDLGCFQYAAPEIYKDKLCSYPVDWWSVGVCLYRFVTGGFPYPTNSRSVYSYYVIKTHKVIYPNEFFADDNLFSLTEKLLITNQAKRLGSRDGHDIKYEPYFGGVNNWNNIDQIPEAILNSSNRDLVWYKETYKNVMSVLEEGLEKESTSKDVRRWADIEALLFDKVDKMNSLSRFV